MDYDACDHILWPYEPEDPDPTDESDLMFADFKLNNPKNDNKDS